MNPSKIAAVINYPPPFVGDGLQAEQSAILLLYGGEV
jgi:hypothetical protein